MKDSLKQNFDEIAADLSNARKNNAFTYWLMLIAGGMLITGLLTIILKTTGIIVLVSAAFVYMANNLLNSWLEIRKADAGYMDSACSERTGCQGAKAAKKMPPPVVVETNKSKTVKINLKG